MGATRFRERPEGASDGDPERRIARLVDAHGAALMRVARHFSLCADDAHDAYQRALEIYLRRLESVDPVTEGAWMRVVVRHEAMAVRRARSASVNGEDVDFDARPANDARPPEDRAESTERRARSAEALRRLKPDEAAALLLKAEGHTYGEIAERKGWTYTKVNRAITEGRRRFLKAYAELERGDGCDAFRPALVELAAGAASAETLLELRPHLRHCPACRATVRELRGGRRRIAAWLPLPAWVLGRPAGRGRASEPEPLDFAANAVEAGGGPVLSPGRWAELKLHLQSLLHRLGGSDVATSAQLAASSGGGRATGSIAVVIGICISSVGAGGYCVATLVLPERREPVERKAERQAERQPARERPARRAPVRLARPRVPGAEPTPVARAAKPEPRRRRPSTVASRAPDAHEASPPPSPPAPQQAQEIGFEQAGAAGPAGPSGPAEPAAAPATGGGEFAP